MELYWIVIIAVLLNTIGSIYYIIETLKGRTKPNKVTWGIWAAAPLIGSAGMVYSEGFIWSALPVFMAGFLPLLIFISSFINKKAYWELKTLDYICLVLSILALLLWWITEDPLLAIIFGVLADFLAAIPIIIKMFNYPETEVISPFYLGLVSAFSSFFVIKNWTIEEYLFLLYLVIMLVVTILAFYGKRILKIK